MRLLQLSVPLDERDTILSELDNRELGYTVSAGAGPHEDRLHVQVAVPADAVEYVLDDLVESGYDRDGYTASVAAEFATFHRVDEVQNRWNATPNRIAPTTLRSKAKGLRRDTRSYLWMMILSAIVATAGLVIGSPAIVVGSMVIAPIVSPMMTASVGAIRNDRRMFINSVHQQALGLAIAVITATTVAAVIRWFTLTPDPLAIAHLDLVAVRLAPSVLAIIVGVAAGAAGAYGLATTGRVTMVGVMIAAALIPTAAAAGIGIAWLNVSIAVGATSLLLVTVIMVNVGATVMLLYLGYRPDSVDEGIFDWENTRTGAIVLATLLISALVIGTVAIGAVDQSQFDREVDRALTDVMDEEEYAGLVIENVAVQHDTPEWAEQETVVTVTVARPAGEEYAGLPDAFERTIESYTDERVVVQVQFVDYERADTS